jgi:2,3-bisphosphoglycerate-dependent phosphoglycerate mutase
MSSLVLVRHGKSHANKEGVIAGHFDTPLHEDGYGQARQAAELVKDVQFDKAFSSTLQRSRHTLKIILEALVSHIEAIQVEDFKERNWGTMEGKYSDNRNNDFTREEALHWKTWGVRPPGGESNEEVYKRMVGGYEKHIAPELLLNKNVILVGHNGSLKRLQAHLEGVPLEEADSLHLENAEAKVYSFMDGKVVSVELRSIHKT